MSQTLEDFAPSLSTLNHPQVEVEGSLQSLAVIEKSWAISSRGIDRSCLFATRLRTNQGLSKWSQGR